MMANSAKYALFKDGEKVSDYYGDFMGALLHAIDVSVVKIIDGAEYNRETRTLKLTASHLYAFQYELPKAPVDYQICKIQEM